MTSQVIKIEKENLSYLIASYLPGLKESFIRTAVDSTIHYGIEYWGLMEQHKIVLVEK